MKIAILMGAAAHDKVKYYINQLEKGTNFVEIGACNPPRPGSSTHTLFEIVNSHECKLYSVDPNEERMSLLPQMLPDVYSSDNFEMVNKTGEQFFDEYWKTGNKPISYIYMDGFDWMYNPIQYRLDPNSFTQKQQHEQYLEYKAEGIELSNLNSSASHLKQTIKAEPLMNEKSIILFDDTFWVPEHEVYVGKGGSSVTYLISKGWEIIPFNTDGLLYPHLAVMLGKNIKIKKSLI